MSLPRPPLFPSIWRYALVYHGLFLLLLVGVLLISLSGAEVTTHAVEGSETSFSLHSSRDVSLGGVALVLPGMLACIWPALHDAIGHPDTAGSRAGLLRLTLACAIGSSPWWIAIQALFLITGGWMTALISGIVMSLLFAFHVLLIGLVCAIAVTLERKLHA